MRILQTRADKILAGFLLVILTMVGFGLMKSPMKSPQKTQEIGKVHAGGPEPQIKDAEIDPEAFRRSIIIPVQGVSASDIRDTFDEARGPERKHEATDILAPRGTAVLAADDGEIKKLFLSKPGGLTLYQFDSTGQYCYYYAHLDRYADGLLEGMKVRRGDVIGHVGTTGNAPPDTPHLHFGIFKLGPEKRWWEGIPINPYPILIAKAQ
jgi:murein DD-endopeptidase MepM/ murein hydrolase activator NlpD